MPLFKKKEVRQAFNYAVDKKAIVKKILFDTAEVMDGGVSPILFGYEKMAKQYDYNPEKAKELLKKAGFDFNQVVRMGTPTGRYLFDKQVSEAVQAYLQAIGIKVELRTYDWPTFMSAVYKPTDQATMDMDFARMGSSIPGCRHAVLRPIHLCGRSSERAQFGFLLQPRI